MPKYSEWKDQVASIVERRMGVGLDEVDVDEDVMRSWWREGHSPKEYVNENVTAPDVIWEETSGVDLLKEI